MNTESGKKTVWHITETGDCVWMSALYLQVHHWFTVMFLKTGSVCRQFSVTLASVHTDRKVYLFWSVLSWPLLRQENEKTITSDTSTQVIMLTSSVCFVYKRGQYTPYPSSELTPWKQDKKDGQSDISMWFKYQFFSNWDDLLQLFLNN